MSIKPDLTRIRDYTPGDNQEKPTTIRLYSNGEKELLYINASHVLGTDNPTCDKIREAITALKPSRIIVEANAGLPLLENSEVAFAASLGRAQHIPVIAAEPSDAVIFNGIQTKGYSAKDVMALYLLRRIPQDRQHGLLMDEAHFAERAEQFLKNHPAFETIPPTERLTYKEFKSHYAPKLGKDFMNAVTDDFAPFTHESATYFQKLNAVVGRIREEHLNTVISDTLNQPDVQKILVVYGGAHRTISEPVWEHALGIGADVKSTHIWTAQPRNQQTYIASFTSLFR